MSINESAQLDGLTVPAVLNTGEQLPLAKSRSDSQDKLIDVAKKFEGMLIHEMFKQVKQELESLKDQDSQDPEESDTCDEQYQSLYWSQMADAVTDKGGIGLWKTIYSGLGQSSQNQTPGGLLNEGI